MSFDIKHMNFSLSSQLLLLMTFQTGSVRAFSSPAGVVVLAVGASLCVVAYRVMMRIGRLPVERRILA